MKKKYYILALTFLCLLCGQMGYAQDMYGGELDEVIIFRGNVTELDEVIIINDRYNDTDYTCDDLCFCYGICFDNGTPDPEYSYSCNLCGYDPCVCDPNSGSGDTPPEVCNITSCPVGYNLIDCECIKDSCTTESIAAGVATTNLFKNNAVSTTMSQMPILTPNNTQQLEHGFNIRNVNGIISTTPIREGTATGLPSADYSLSVIADLHDHPAPGTFAPSAQDLFALDDKRDKISGFTTSYVVSTDGNIYALYIDDAAKLNAFVNNNPGFVGSDESFKKGTDIGNYFWDTNYDLQTQGYTPQEAYTRATALVLQDAGVSLLKSDATTIDFKKIDIKVVGDDPNGNTIIIINDCK